MSSRTEREIETQRSDYDCTVCCLAMLTGRDYGDVLAVIGDTFDPTRGVRYEHKALERLGFDPTYHVGDFTLMHVGILSPGFFRMFAWGRPALMTVPSLNYPDADHMIFWDGSRVCDPSQKKKYRDWTELYPSDMVIFRSPPVTSPNSIRHPETEKGRGG